MDAILTLRARLRSKRPLTFAVRNRLSIGRRGLPQRCDAHLAFELEMPRGGIIERSAAASMCARTIGTGRRMIPTPPLAPSLEPPALTDVRLVVARDAARARWLLWIAFWTMLASVSIGLSWDAAWHTTRGFETAFSPPHLFIYATTALTCALYVTLVATPGLRRAFGRGFRAPGVPYPLHGSLFLVGSGLGLLALGAMLDVVWHSAFGLDETRWSVPHAMLGWGWSLAAFGFVAARLALRTHRPLRWWTRGFLAFILLAATLGPLVGPFQNNHTPAKVAAVANIPVLAEQSAYQHTARVYLDWRVVRSNPTFVVLGALWVGITLVVVRSVDRRLLFLVAVIALWTAFAALKDRGAVTRLGLDPMKAAGWLPIPLLPAALVAAVLWRFNQGPRTVAGVSGAAFGLLCQAIWPAPGGPVVAMVLGAAFAVLGTLAGARLASILERPTARSCTVLAAVSLAAPFVSGAVDLYLRFRTPWS